MHRAIQAQRLLSAYLADLGATFTLQLNDRSEPVALDGAVVLSSSMMLPAVVCRAEAIATHLYGSAEMLEVKRRVNELCALGVDVEVGLIDGSPVGLLRSLLLTRACEQVFGIMPDGPPQQVDLGPVARYYQQEGANALRGNELDVLPATDMPAAYKTLGPSSVIALG